MNQDEINQIKQAVREVLLSKEFLQAFAEAWWTTPILHESQVNFGPSVFQPKEHKSPEVALSEQPKPAFAVGDRVRVCKPGSVFDLCDGSIVSISDDGEIRVWTGERLGSWVFNASELQPVEASK